MSYEKNFKVKKHKLKKKTENLSSFQSTVLKRWTTSSSAISSNLSQNLWYAFGSSISTHRFYLYNGRGMGIAIPYHFFHQGPKWSMKAV